MSTDDLKRRAAYEAVTHVRSGMVLGLGHGSTAAHAVERVAQLLAEGKLAGITAIPCSEVVDEHARRLGINLSSLNEHPRVDLTIDGADEVDPQLRLIKGGGGALLREKMVAEASLREIIIVDSSKLSPTLGAHWPVPVEVVRFGWHTHVAYLERLGAHTVCRREVGGAPHCTDQGNYLLDAAFGPIHDPEKLAGALAARTGVVAHGLFLGLATDLIVASTTGLRHITAARERTSHTRGGRMGDG